MSPTLDQAWYDLSRAFTTPITSGKIRQKPEHFYVSERLSFEATGSGEHTLVEIEKTGVNTQWVAKQLARFCRVSTRDVGFAGLKDRHAIATQWFSVLHGQKREPDWQTLTISGLKVKSWIKHNKKLRRGALHSNQFRIRIVDIEGDLDEVKARCAHVVQEGVPNYFGRQRYGNNGANLQGAQAWFEGKTRSPRRSERAFYLSAARSFLFNQILSQRVLDHNWNILLPGDVAVLNGSNSHFPVTDIDDQLRSRVVDFDLSPSAALWGEGSLHTSGTVRDLEQHVANSFPVFVQGLTRNRLRQERRTLRVRPEAFKMSTAGSDVILVFELGPGAFATSILRELVRVTASHGSKAVNQRS